MGARKGSGLSESTARSTQYPAQSSAPHKLSSSLSLAQHDSITPAPKLWTDKANTTTLHHHATNASVVHRIVIIVILLIFIILLLLLIAIARSGRRRSSLLSTRDTDGSTETHTLRQEKVSNSAEQGQLERLTLSSSVSTRFLAPRFLFALLAQGKP